KYPDAKRDRSLYVNRISEEGKGSMQSGPVSFYFLTHYAGSLKTPVKIGISSGFNGTNTYVNNKKIAVNYKYTNADFWNILEFDFVEGKSFGEQEVKNADKVAAITEDFKNEYFGNVPTVVGTFFEADNVKYRVIGVIKGVPVTSYMLYSDIYLPYTVAKDAEYKTNKSYH